MPYQRLILKRRPSSLLIWGTSRLRGAAKAPVVVLLLLLPRTRMSQTTAGSISGVVLHTRWAVVPNATISGQNEGQNTTVKILGGKNVET
jgi:hypothetical protein